MTAPPPAGWYPDPHQPGQQRWWAGSQWTADIIPAYGAQAYYPRPPRNSHKGLWITLGVVGVLLVVFLGLGFGLLFHDRNGARSAAKDYLSDLESGNYAGAYDLLCPDDQLQATEQQFAQAKTDDRPSSFSLGEVHIHTGQPKTASVDYTATAVSGGFGVGSLPEEKAGSKWLVCHSLIPGQGPTGDTSPDES